MDLLNSLTTSLFGITVVFGALILLIILIILQSFLVSAFRKGKAAKIYAAEPLAASTARQAPAPALPSGPPELKLIGVDEKTAAMIMAIVCEASSCAPNELYFKSIRVLDEVQGSMEEGV